MERTTRENYNIAYNYARCLMSDERAFNRACILDSVPVNIAAAAWKSRQSFSCEQSAQGIAYDLQVAYQHGAIGKVFSTATSKQLCDAYACIYYSRFSGSVVSQGVMDSITAETTRRMYKALSRPQVAA